MTLTEIVNETLKRMKKGTIMQRLDIADCKTDTTKIRAWMNVGFTALRSRRVWNFGEVEETQLIKTDAQGLNWVLE